MRWFFLRWIIQCWIFQCRRIRHRLGLFVNDVIRPTQAALAVTLTGTHDIARLFQLLNRRPDRVDLLPVDKGQAFQRKIPILRQGQHLRQQPLGFQGQVLVPQVVVGHHRVAPVFLHSKNCHLVVHSFHLKFHRAVKGGELARLVGTFLIHTKLVLPVRAVETAGAAVLRRSGLAAVKMICARPRLHELFKGPVAAGSKVHRRSPPFWFWAQKKRRPDLSKGEKRTPLSAVSYSIFDVSLFGWWASREAEACQSSIRK